MPATPQRLTPQKLAVIAGSGELPARLLAACDRKNIETFVVAVEGQTDTHILQGRDYIVIRPGTIGHMISTLRAHDIRDLVMIGAVRRPSLAELKPDMWTAKFFARVGLKALGDDGLLGAFRRALADEGFTIHGVQSFADDLLTPAGLIGRHKPHKDDRTSINHALTVARALGQLDIGQSVVVQEDIILGVEGVEGTDELIRRCSAYKREGRGPILVKACKPQQDRDLDLPTIGPDTVITAIEAGFSGIVMEAGRSLLVEQDKVVELADMNRIFLLAVTPGQGYE